MAMISIEAEVSTGDPAALILEVAAFLRERAELHHISLGKLGWKTQEAIKAHSGKLPTPFVAREGFLSAGGEPIYGTGGGAAGQCVAIPAGKQN